MNQRSPALAEYRSRPRPAMRGLPVPWSLVLLLGVGGCVGHHGNSPSRVDAGGGEATDAAVPIDSGRLADPCNPPVAGCPCTGAIELSCYPGPPETRAVGECAVGTIACQEGRFGQCRAAVTPRPEICDARDNDCDGATDEDLADCHPCGPHCQVLNLGAGTDLPFTLGRSEGGAVRINPQGELTLEAQERVLNDIWIANTDEGTVSRLDATTGRELARYPSVHKRPELRAWNEPCGRDPGQEKGNCPSRTAVNLQGDVFVANRAFAGQGSLTKILGAACPDANGDGILKTSRDVDGNGQIDLQDPAEFPNQQDECVAFTVPIGGHNGVLRALAVDPFHPPDREGSVWVGAYTEQAVYQVDASTGEVLARLPLPLKPYGALLDHRHTLWVTALAGEGDAIVAVDTATQQVGPAIPVENPRSCSDHRSKGGYGITIDGVGRIWIGGYFCEDALRYDPVNQSWFAVRLEGRGFPRGIAADAAGYIWVAHSNEAFSPYAKVARVTRFLAEDGSDQRTYLLNGQAETIGVGLDAAGKVWAVSRTSNSATTIDPATGQQTHHPTGRGPYTYSDFTGYALRTFIIPAGLWTMDVRACEGLGTPTWLALRWEAIQPPGTRLQLYLRAADRSDQLPDAFRHGPFQLSPVDLLSSIPRANHLRVEVELEAAGRVATPAIKWIRLEAECPPAG